MYRRFRVRGNQSLRRLEFVKRVQVRVIEQESLLNNMEIRLGKPEDYPAAMTLIAEFAEESLSEYGVYLDPATLQKTFDAVYQTSFCAVVDGRVVGVLAGQIVNDICSTRLVYQEIVWYVTKSHRRYGIKLQRHVEAWCRAHGIERMIMSAMHNSKTEKLFAFYERLGFRPQETKFIKELD